MEKHLKVFSLAAGTSNSKHLPRMTWVPWPMSFLHWSMTKSNWSVTSSWAFSVNTAVLTTAWTTDGKIHHMQEPISITLEVQHIAIMTTRKQSSYRYCKNKFQGDYQWAAVLFLCDKNFMCAFPIFIYVMYIVFK